MDLRAELIGILDDPSAIWEKILASLDRSTASSLMVFSTCTQPASLVEWQEALGRLDPDAAATFQSGLRILDDTFVTTSKRGKSELVAAFRNPSIEDFCYRYLDQNLGVVLEIVRREPSLTQLERLTAIASALGEKSRPSHPALRTALLEHPHRLLLAATEIGGLQEERALRRRVVLVTDLLGTVLDTEVIDEVRARIRPIAETITCETIALTNILDNRTRTRALVRLIGDHIENYYRSVVDSASTLADFDLVVNLDEALGWSGSDAFWADSFMNVAHDSLSSTDKEGVAAERDSVSRILEHLSLEDEPLLSQWNEALAAAELEAYGEPDDDFRRSSDGSKETSEVDAVKAEVDGMFHSLLERPS